MSPCPAYRDLKNLAQTLHLSLPTWKVAGTPINYRTMYLEIWSLPEMDLKQHQVASTLCSLFPSPGLPFPPSYCHTNLTHLLPYCPARSTQSRKPSLIPMTSSVLPVSLITFHHIVEGRICLGFVLFFNCGKIHITISRCIVQ